MLSYNSDTIEFRLVLLKMLTILLIGFMTISSATLTDVSYYEVLGISRQASTLQIKQAYKKLAIKFHPDKTSNPNEHKIFLEITEAYKTLKDPERRRRYDFHGTYTYTRKFDYGSQSVYNDLYYNGLYHEDPFVDAVTENNFYDYLTDGIHFINFYSPFCPPCQNLADHWKKLAEMYKGIVKLGAVNCKLHNSFCYNSMGIGSYPTLIFYPNGNRGNPIYYSGRNTFEALNEFITSYLYTRVYVPTVSGVAHADKPMVYVLGANRFDKDVLARIAYTLKDLVLVVIAEDDDVRAKLTKDEYVTVVFRHMDINIEIKSMEEKHVLKEIIASIHSVGKVELVDPTKFRHKRNELRNGRKTPWILYFSSKGEDTAPVYKLSTEYRNLEFGVVDCDEWSSLCDSLQVERPPAWGVLKPGGAYQMASPSADLHDFMTQAAYATRLHTLSVSDMSPILDGDMGAWIIAVVSAHVSWDHISQHFIRIDDHYRYYKTDINMGIIACTHRKFTFCQQLVEEQDIILFQNGTRRYHYLGQLKTHQNLLDFIQLVRKVGDYRFPHVDLDEYELLEILNEEKHEKALLLAFLPANCDSYCEYYYHQWINVALKLQPLKYIRVGALRCTSAEAGFCRNVRAPTARAYPLGSQIYHTIPLQNLQDEPYMLNWAFSFLIDFVHQLNKKTFDVKLNGSTKKPWLIYFRVPECDRCFEMYSDFIIASSYLSDRVQIGTVDCISEHDLCEHQSITDFPSLKLYLVDRNIADYDNVKSIEVRDYLYILQQVGLYYRKEDILFGENKRNLHFNNKHDEL